MVIIVNIEDTISAAGVSTSSQEWQFVLKHIYINFPVDVKNLNCQKCIPCVFSKNTIVGCSVIKDTQGYIISTETGIVILCPKKNDFPVTDWIPKKDIRIVESESKFLKHSVRLKTNDTSYAFKTDKETAKKIETLINSVRFS